MYAGALFKRTFMDKYKSATTKDWSTQYPIFVEVGVNHMAAAFESQYTKALDLKYLGMKK